MTDVERPGDGRRRRVDREDLGPFLRAVELVGAGCFPMLRPLRLETVEGRPFRHTGGFHSPSTVLACSGSTTRRRASKSPLHVPEQGAPGGSLRLRPDRLRAAAHRPRPSQPRLRRAAALPRVDGGDGPSRLERDRHRRQDHRPRPRGGAPAVRGGRWSTRRRGGRRWTGWALCDLISCRTRPTTSIR